MLEENKEKDKFTISDNLTGKVYVLIEQVAVNTYHAKNQVMEIVAKIIPCAANAVLTEVIEHKRKGKDGRFHKTKNPTRC